VRTNADNTGAHAVGAAPRLDWVDQGRGLAICLVVLFHAANWLLAAGADVRGWLEFNLVASSLRMPLFFVLSGLFAAKWLRGSWRDLWTRKVRLFVWVFCLWTVIGVGAFMLGVRVMLGEGSLRGILLTLVLAPVMPKLELWFIWALALFFVAAKATRRVPPAVQLAVAGVGAAVALSGWVTQSPGWSGAVKYYAFFLFGIYGRDLVLRLGSSTRRSAAAAWVGGWLVVSLVLWRFDLREVPGAYFVNCVLGVGAGVVVSRFVRVPVLRRVGARTLPIYLTHTPVIMVVCSALHLLGVTGAGVAMALLPPVLVAGVVAFAWWLSRAVEGGRWAWLYEVPQRRRHVPTDARRSVAQVPA
jgi:uncharacterized membrane protein YcfT